MTTAATQILERVNALPPLPAAIGRLLRLVNEPDVEFKDIAQTISLDQTLTAQLLRIANSAFYGFPQQIRTVQAATVILGRHAVRNMALSLALVKLRDGMTGEGPLAPEKFWRHSMAVACAARLLATHERAVAPDEAFVAGLLHDIGKVVFVEYDPQTYRELLLQARDGIAPLHVLEEHTFGIDHAEVGKALCTHWNIPEMLAASVAAHHGAEADAETLEVVDVVNVADTLAKICHIGDGGNPLVSASWLSRSAAFSMKVDRVREVLQSLPDEVNSNEQIFFNGPSVTLVGNGSSKSRRTVHLGISSPDDYTLLNFALRMRGCRIAAPDEPAVDLVISDRSPSPAERIVHEQNNVMVQDYAEWRDRQIDDQWINVSRLHSWLTEILSPLATA